MQLASLTIPSLILLLLTAALSIWLVYRVFRRLSAANGTRWLEIRIEEVGGFGSTRLALISALSLFLEMLMIRWVCSEIMIFAYFKNFVLVACFLGFGLGCYVSRRPVQLAALLSPLLLLAILLKTSISPLHRSIAALPQLLGASVEVHTWGVPAAPASWSGVLLAMIFVVPLFALIATAFIPFGQLVGWFLENAPKGVSAYSINVLASLAGIGAFTLLCFLNQPPWVWFLVAAILCAMFFWPSPRARTALGITFLLCISLLALRDSKAAKTYWSPYQKLTVRPQFDHGQLVSYLLTTNNASYQTVVDLSPKFVEAHADEFRQHPLDQNAYNMPYRFYPSPPSVLVLGSGMGNDVAAALRNGAGHVEAVEIDPLILKLGEQLHFEHPYQSPRVHVTVNDARNYIENSHESFDLIVFSLLDSHTTTSHFTNIRLDNYVYTRESLARAKQMLKPGGLLVVKFWVETPWIAGRLYDLVQTTFGQEPIQFQTDLGNGYDSAGRFFVVGSPETLSKAASDLSLSAYLASHRDMAIQQARVTTDDWPYFYQHAPGLPVIVILVSIAVLIVFGWFLRQVSGEGAHVDLHFMFLGAGFMLLEAQIVSKMALLFGTTWMVNAVVVSGLLCLIVAANLVYEAMPRIPLAVAYTGLFFTLAILYLVPMQKLFFESWSLRALIATLALCSPVFFAGIIFVSSFARVGFRGSALGSNLFGSLIGGLLESASLWFGLKSLTILAAILYLASAIFLRQAQSVEKRSARESVLVE
ncbi:MAG TPA: methyltransferase domain-containing protein [Candidatus Eisenbacteria bacterium]|nr:methyltransferase domain-containing protein [Candidatus Eisenbacteria bacterium]